MKAEERSLTTEEHLAQVQEPTHNVSIVDVLILETGA